MKILWLYKYAKTYNMDHWFHMDLARYISNMEGLELKDYGLFLEDAYMDCVCRRYDPNLTLFQIYKKYKFDVIICNTKSRMFDIYRPKGVGPAHEVIELDMWLPEDFATFNCPKIMIEEDSHYEVDDLWYAEMGFDLVLERHKSNAERGNAAKGFGNVPHLWHPFSVDEQIFCPYPERPTKTISFSGSCSEEIYPYRHMALTKLKKLCMCNEVVLSKKKLDREYLKAIRDAMVCVCGSSKYNITPAKMFEIMSCGTVLFTNKNDGYGLKELYPDDTYLTYKEDGSDIVEKAMWIKRNVDKVKEIGKRGRQCILERHTNEIRVREMVKIIEAL